MPVAAPKPCRHPSCGETVASSGYCPQHQRQHRQAADANRPNAYRRGYDKRWARLRIMVLRREPICRICGKAEATEVDHIVTKARGGDDSYANLQGLCKPCHSRKTATEDGGGWR